MVTVSNALDYTLDLKEAFVKSKLAPLLMTLFSDIREVSYEAVRSSGGAYAESETVTVDFKNGSAKKINVSGDSCLQITKDVLKKFD